MIVFWLLLANTTGSLTEMVGMESTLDSNTAFYEGKDKNYVLSPPIGFTMVTEKAQTIGYSFAFLPEGQSLDSAYAMIGATIYDLTLLKENVTFNSILTEDTARLREYYGNDLQIWPVDSMTNFRGDIIPTYYFNDPHRFIPTVMVSYYDGDNEMLILELNISDRIPRFEAEKIFEAFLQQFKVLKTPK